MGDSSERECGKGIGGARRRRRRYDWYSRETAEMRLVQASAPGELKPVQTRHVAVAKTLHRILEHWRDVQLAYYARPEYYGIYYPPPTPQLLDEDFQILDR
jgi:hypothetical protein